MSEEEIKRAAREYAEDVFRELREHDGLYHLTEEEWELSIDDVAKDATDALKWLCRDYCMVPKELIRKRYRKAESVRDLYTSATCINEMESSAIDRAQGRMCELTALFGEDFLRINDE